MDTPDFPTAAHLAPTPLIDADHPAVTAFAREHARGPDATTDADATERAVALYYAVRDGFRYDPYRVDFTPDGMRASSVLTLGYGWCVPKAALLAAACRAIGIPARLGYADVRNHLSTERMRQSLQSDLYLWHGYTEIWLADAWRKATPAFNIELCDRFGLLPLEFNGRDDSIYHAFDRAGNRHMEYVHQRGTFDEMPLAEMAADFARFYPGWKKLEPDDANFMADVEREVQR